MSTDIANSIYPNAYYRVSVKAAVTDNQGHILVVKEHSDDWVLPGGGIDHGENITTALERELKEEAGIHSIDHFKIKNIYTLFSDKHSAWFMWILCEVSAASFDINELIASGIQAKFIDISELKNSTKKPELQIYEALRG